MTLSKGEKGGLLVFRAKFWHDLLKISNLAQHFSVFPTNHIECIDPPSAIQPLSSDRTLLRIILPAPSFCPPPHAKAVARSFLHDCLLRGASAISELGCVISERRSPPIEWRTLTLFLHGLLSHSSLPLIYTSSQSLTPSSARNIMSDSHKLHSSASPPYLLLLSPLQLFISTKHENAALLATVEGRARSP